MPGVSRSEAQPRLKPCGMDWLRTVAGTARRVVLAGVTRAAVQDDRTWPHLGPLLADETPAIWRVRATDMKSGPGTILSIVPGVIPTQRLNHS